MSTLVHCHETDKLQKDTPQLPLIGMNYVAEEVRKAREEAGLSQEDVGKLINMSQSNYNKYETGKRRITDDVLIRLRDEAGIPLDLEALQDIALLDKYGHERLEKVVKRAKTLRK